MKEEDIPQKIFLDKMKEDRGWYFAEYTPPRVNSLLAHLVLVVYDKEHTDLTEIADSVENEAGIWLARYPVPIFACVVDYKEENINLGEVKPTSFLKAFSDPITKEVQCHWDTITDDQIPYEKLTLEVLQKVYSDVPYKTDEDISATTRTRTKEMKIGLAIIFAWVVVVPATIAILGWANPVVSMLALLYSLYKAYDKGMELLGKKKKSAKQAEQDEKRRKSEHFYYHCIRNPEGFERLKQENFEKEAAAQIQLEVKQLKKNES